MSNTVLNDIVAPLEAAAIPAVVAVLKEVNTFIANMGTDPQQWMVKFPGALAVLEGNVLLQVPVLESAEATALATQVTSGINNLIAKLNAQVPQA